MLMPTHRTVLCTLVALCCLLSAPAQHPLSNDAIIHHIDLAVHDRSESIITYTVQELYTVYRNGATDPSAQVTVRTVYTRTTGKEYTPTAQSGSAFFRSIIIDKVLATEKEMAKADNRDNVAVTSANYDMQLVPGNVTWNGHDCILMNIKARRKATYLFNGKAWFDASDYTLAHLEGTPAGSLSLFAGNSSGSRDYAKIDGLSMAQHADMHVHSFLFGDTIMKIDYSNYQIQFDPKPTASN
jgi:hypothetical protein